MDRPVKVEDIVEMWIEIKKQNQEIVLLKNRINLLETDNHERKLITPLKDASVLW